ncbi:MAG: alkaline phosphatase D family protein [Candidatus Cyclobacteriaceae bacterium M3_2C_046]
MNLILQIFFLRLSALGPRLSIILICLITFSTFQQAWAQAGNFTERNGITFSPRWLNNLVILNNMGEGKLPTEKQMLYVWAETALAGQEEDSYSSLINYHGLQSHCTDNNIVHLGGPMQGNISENSVDVWLRTVKPDTVTVKVKIDGQYKTFGPAYTSAASELAGVVKVNGLQPATSYPYQVFVGEKSIEIPENAMIKTTPATENENTRIIFGSCFHRWGLGNMNQTHTILSRQPHAFMGLGDIAAQDKMDNMGWHSLDYLARDLYPAWQKLVAEVPFYALWDDHDYFGNDMAGTPRGFEPEDKEDVWKVFRHAWANPSYGFGEEGKGVFFRTRIGAADLIVIDHRYFRTDQSFLGEQQMQWLEEQLLDCKGPFIILAGGTMWSDYVSRGKDSWGRTDPEAREKIFSLIEKHQIPGVLLISGDRHGSRGFTIPRPSGYNFYEFEVASLGGLAGPPATRPEWQENQLYGISGGYAFGEFTFDTKPKDPTVTFRLIDENGGFIKEMTLKRSELTPGR